MNPSPRFAVAPMMDRTDRHCRFFLRQFTRRAQLFTEMIVADALLYGDRKALLRHDPTEHPLALQIGGSDPLRLAEAARIAVDHGYREINLNVGCPSDRVQSAAIGACLMRHPGLVGACVEAIKSAVSVRVTVKCRLGVDEQDPELALDDLADATVAAGVDGLWVHARKAWLSGLSPKENRFVPPLDYDRVIRLKKRLPNVFVGLNGGLADIESCKDVLDHVDGAMIGRAAYDRPAILISVDHELFGDRKPDAIEVDAALAVVEYAERLVAEGTPIARITRHMLGLFHGAPGARAWRRYLTTAATRSDADARIIAQALAERSESASAAGDRSLAA